MEFTEANMAEAARGCNMVVVVVMGELVDDRVICRASIRGTTILVSFPPRIFLHYGMKAGDIFHWRPSELGVVRLTDCIPVYGDEELSAREFASMIDFVESGDD